jgi:hypothetical protein
MADRLPGGNKKHAVVSDDQVKALLDDLDSSITSFDERLRAFEAETAIATPGFGRSTDVPFPCLDLGGQHAWPELPGKSAHTLAQTPSQTPPPARTRELASAETGRGASSAPDLLTELARSAEAHAQNRIVDSRLQQEVEQRFDQVLRTIFDYLHEFTRHVNVLKPVIPLTYALDFSHRFGALQWAEGFVDFRTRSKSEIALIESVSVRLRYATPTLDIIQPLEKVHALRHELHLLNLTITDEEKVVIPGKGHGIRFTLADSIPVQLTFRSDSARGKIVVRGRNIGALGLCAYLIDLNRLARTSLDAVGLNLLGRSSRLPAEFVPVAFSSKV